MWKIDENPFIKILMVVSESKKSKRDPSTRIVKFGHRNMTFECFDENKENLISFSPNFDSILKSLLKPIEKLISIVNSFFSLELDLLPLLNISKKNIFYVTESNENIQEGIKTIKNLLITGFQEPTEILNKFIKYEYLLEINQRRYIRQLFEEKNKIEFIDLNLIEKNLHDLQNVKNKILTLDLNVRKLTFFQLSSEDCKNILISKTNLLINSIL